MNYKQLLTVFGLGLVAGAIAVYYLYPRIEYRLKTETKTETQLQIRTVTRTVERPDGTKVIEQVTTDNSKIVQKSKSDEQKLLKPNYLLSAGVSVEFPISTPTYSIGVQKRLLGPIFAGIQANTDKEFGLLVTLEF